MKFITFDFETTGLHSQKHEIIELSFAKFANGEIVDTFSSLVKPQSLIPDNIISLTQITPQMVESAPSIETLAPKISTFIANDLLIAYNARFDKSFLNVMLYKAKIHSHFNPYTCALKLAQRALKLSYMPKLSEAVTRLGITLPEGLHRAEVDATVTGLVVMKCLEILNWNQLDLMKLSMPLKVIKP